MKQVLAALYHALLADKQAENNPEKSSTSRDLEMEAHSSPGVIILYSKYGEKNNQDNGKYEPVTPVTKSARCSVRKPLPLKAVSFRNFKGMLASRLNPRTTSVDGTLDIALSDSQEDIERILKSRTNIQALESSQNHLKHGGAKPECALDQNYCLFDEEYPMDKVHEIINNYHDDVHHMYHGLNYYPAKDYISHDNFTHGYRHKGSFVCESEVTYIRPGWARNWKNQWVAVVNTDKYPQSLRMELCKYGGKRCEYLPPCYKSFCVQRYTYVKLLCVDPLNTHHRPVVDVFEIPSYINRKCNRICVEGEWKKPTLSTPKQDSNLDLLIIGSLVYCENSVLDLTATEKGPYKRSCLVGFCMNGKRRLILPQKSLEHPPDPQNTAEGLGDLKALLNIYCSLAYVPKKRDAGDTSVMEWGVLL
uniref:Spaetzle domain-containing protein n=1 Tax=Timema shepardi TaxID=629360 RepID=A0A7R9B4U7_TIMSH|nr:unnamed protein product [Timema shepardi]